MFTELKAAVRCRSTANILILNYNNETFLILFLIKADHSLAVHQATTNSKISTLTFIIPSLIHYPVDASWASG